MNKKYQICSRCVMDSSDPEISFDNNGFCNHCTKVETIIKPQWFPNELGEQKLQELISKIKAEGRTKPYDCIIGLSGGVDSSYLAYIAKTKYGLNPLAVHVDAGWNSDEAVSNIENLTKKLGIDLHTIVINWEEIKDLHLAYLKASIANQDVPQDHAFFAGLYNHAVKHGIKYVINGTNFSTESILPSAWGYNALDSKNLLSIHKRYGKTKLKTFPIVSFFKYYFYYPFIKKMEVVSPLNFMPYYKAAAMEILEKEVGWKYYGGKHHESRFTKFFQSYYLPTKFGYDKRKAHLSSQIMSGEITRDEALEELKKPAYDEKTIKSDMEFVAKKLGISYDELQGLIKAPARTYTDFDSNAKLLEHCQKIRKLLKVRL